MMNAPVRISVVIPTHNRPDLLRRAIYSCLRQLALPCEILVVDNGARVSAKNVLSAEFKDVGILRFLDSKKNDARAALQLGLDNAKSDWVIFLDDDDVLASDRISTDSAWILKNEGRSAVYFHDFIRYDKNSEVVTIHKLYESDLTLSNAYCLTGFGPQVIGTWRVSALRSGRGYQGRGLLDYDLIAQVLSNHEPGYIPVCGYFQDDAKSPGRLTTNPRKSVTDYIYHYLTYRAQTSRCDRDLDARVQASVRRASAFVIGRSGLLGALKSKYRAFVLRYPTAALKGRFAYLRRTPLFIGIFRIIRVRGGLVMRLSDLPEGNPSAYKEVKYWFHEFK